MKNRIIFHLDMDAFFASVEEVYNPQFRGKPIVIGADPKEGAGRGVVSTANYKARTFGIHSAMPISKAWRLCPDAVFLPVNGALYARVSKQIMATLKEYTPAIQQVSVDEAFMDMSHLRTWRAATEQARAIQQDIKKREGVTCSIGIAPNKLVAKIASDFQKPNGITVVTPNKVMPFLAPMPARVIPGIGPKAAHILTKRGIETIRQLQECTEAKLLETFGKRGAYAYKAARGLDTRPVVEEKSIKSIGEEHTFSRDTKDFDEIIQRIFGIVDNVVSLARQDFQGFRTVTIIVRFEDFQKKSRSYSEDFPNDVEYVKKRTLRLVWPLLQDRRRVRLVGVRISNLV